MKKRSSRLFKINSEGKSKVLSILDTILFINTTSISDKDFRIAIINLCETQKKQL